MAASSQESFTRHKETKHPKIVQEQNREQMEWQGKLLKTFLNIASVIYTQTFGAPVKRDTCTSSGDVIEDGKARLTSINDALCNNVTQFSYAVKDFSEFSEDGIANNDTDVYLEALLKDSNFTQMVREAVLMCFSSSTTDCKLARAALTLQDIINSFIDKYKSSGENFTYYLGCKPTDAEMLCWANTYTVNLLNKVLEM